MSAETIPAKRAVLITPHDTNTFLACRGVSLQVAGDLAVRMQDDPTVPVIIPGLAAGIIHPLCVVGVRSTGTAATGITAYY